MNVFLFVLVVVSLFVVWWDTLQSPTLKVKKMHPNAVVPSYATPWSAGLDLTAVSCYPDLDDRVQVYRTGLAFEIPPGYVGLLFPRSSVSKYEMSLANSVGVIDSDYRGEVLLKFRLVGPKMYKVGDRVGQLVVLPLPALRVQEEDELTSTVRGSGGFGSTGG